MWGGAILEPDLKGCYRVQSNVVLDMLVTPIASEFGALCFTTRASYIRGIASVYTNLQYHSRANACVFHIQTDKQ